MARRCLTVDERRRAEWRTTKLKKLFDRGAERQQLLFVEGGAEEVHSDRQPVISESSRNGQRRKTRVSTDLAVGAPLRVSNSCRLAAKRWIHDRRQPVLIEHSLECMTQSRLLDSSAPGAIALARL